MNRSGWRRAGLFSVLTLLTLVALAVLAVAYVARNIKVTRLPGRGGEAFSIKTPGGEINVRSHRNIDPAALGMPMYPNATRVEAGKGATVEWTSPDGTNEKAISVAGSDYVTTDSAQTVLAWYRSHLPNWVVVTDREDSNAHFELNDGGYKRIIAVRSKSDGTHIGVATVGEPASN